MKQNNLEVSYITYTALLKVCTNNVAFEQGKRLHLEISANSIPKMQTALINFYGKCGHLEEAMKIFRESTNCDIATWNTIINIYGLNGNGKLAVELFQEMQRNNVAPDLITFQKLLNVCSINGMLKEILYYFELMQKQYDMKPRLEHYNYIVDCYSRAGKLDEIEKFTKIPQVRESMKRQKMKDIQPGTYFIEIHGVAHTFHANEPSHPQHDVIIKEIEKLNSELKTAGYKSDTTNAPKEEMAVAFGMMETPPKTPLLIASNLRISPDCHSTLSAISKVNERVITLRDAHRVHQFKDGKCSCNDYW